MRLPQNPTAEQLAIAYQAGLLPKSVLEHGAYYKGKCRNASCARWHAPTQQFIHWREKFGHRYLTAICHPEDEPVFDVFLATDKVDIPAEGELVVPDDQFDEVAVREQNARMARRAVVAAPPQGA